jgi:dGTPase
MSRFGERFEHNLHALRIVESFENPYPRFSGLNLTFEVREGIVKHSRDLAPGEIPELDEYLPGLRPPLEAQMIDLCDEIAYNSADLDDGYSAGLVTVEDACAGVTQFRELYEAAEMQFPGAPEKVRVQEVVRGLINWLVSGLMEGTVAACAKLARPEEVREHAGRAAQFSPAAAAGTRELKQFLRTKVYCSDAVTHTRSQLTGSIAALFEFFLEHPERLPAAYRAESAGQPLHRSVCDYIAGMTDGFFLRTCAQVGISD